MQKFVIGYIFLFHLFFTANAQTRISNQNLDEEKETKEIRYWAIKTDLMEMANGTYTIGFEKSINESFTFSVYGGLTGKNFLYSLLQEVNMESKPNKGDFLWKETSSNPLDIINRDKYSVSYHEDRTYGIGFAAGISPTYYFLKDPSEGAYINFLAMFKNFNVTALYNGNEIGESQNRLNLTLNFGRKQPLGDNAFIDFNFGLGMAFVNDPKSVSYTDRSGVNPQENMGIIYWSPTRMHAQFGVIVGFNKY